MAIVFSIFGDLGIANVGLDGEVLSIPPPIVGRDGEVGTTFRVPESILLLCQIGGKKSKSGF